jgi:hypothetical protein
MLFQSSSLCNLGGARDTHTGWEGEIVSLHYLSTEIAAVQDGVLQITVYDQAPQGRLCPRP